MPLGTVRKNPKGIGSKKSQTRQGRAEEFLKVFKSLFELCKVDKFF